VKREAFRQILRFAPNTDGGSGGAGTSGAGGSGASGQGEPGSNGDNTSPTWDAWYGALDADGKRLVDEHVSGLKNAVTSERRQVRELSQQVRDLQSKAEKGSELEGKLSELSAQLEESQRRSAFTEWAVKNNVVDPTLAFLAAKEAKVFDNSGAINGERLRELHPNLFAPEEKPKAGGRGDAGSGSQGGGAPSKFDGNAFLAQAAGINQRTE